MEWLNNCIGRQSETEIIDLQDSNTKEVVNKILSRTKEKKLNRNQRKKAKRPHSKKTKVPKDRTLNIHHQIARHEWGSEHSDNKKLMDIKKHNADHMLFGTKLIHDKLIQILEDNKSVLNQETSDLFIWELQQLIKWYIEEQIFYNDKCFNRWKLPRNYNI